MVVHRRGAMIDIAKIATRQPLPPGPRVRIISNSQTLAQQMIQAAKGVGLLPGDEPKLLGSAADPEDFATAARAALADPEFDSVVCGAVNVFDRGTSEVIVALDAVATEATKPLVGVFLDFHAPVMSGDTPDRPGGLPTFDAHADAIQALSALSAYAHWRDRDPGAVPLLDVDEQTVKRVVNQVLAAAPEGRELTESETAEVLRAYGITIVPRFRVASLDEACQVAERLGWDVVLKATAKAVRGRPDLGSVHRNIDDPEEMASAWSDLGRLVRDLGLPVDDALTAAEPVVQVMAPAGVALVIGSQEDAAFGPIISLGLEGIPSELLGDIVYRVPPLTTVDASAMVRDLRAAPTLFGRHGASGVHIPSIEDLLHRIAQLADHHPQLASITLSPCVVSSSSISVLGARVQLEPTPDQRDPLARGL
jgi:acyl-CoA synthetase (NDP forming)